MRQSQPQVETFLSARFQPTIQDTSAWKYERMRTIIIYDRQFEIAVEGCGCYRLPFHASKERAMPSICP
jgi:hypothetical protein